MESVTLPLGHHAPQPTLCRTRSKTQKTDFLVTDSHIKRKSWTTIEISFLAHLSRRLTGELIGYPWIRRPSVVVRPSTISNVFSSETAWPIKAKFFVEYPWEGGRKVYINGPDHMTKMAATPIYGKNPSKIFFSRTGGPIFTKLGM